MNQDFMNPKFSVIYFSFLSFLTTVDAQYFRTVIDIDMIHIDPGDFQGTCCMQVTRKSKKNGGGSMCKL